MRIYTRGGDKGTTALIYGKRVAKNDLRVDAYGTCDEANSMIGLAISQFQLEQGWNEKNEFIAMLHRIQSILFHVGSELATPIDKEVAWKLKQEHITQLEEQIDLWDKELPVLTNFILPGGHPGSASLLAARTVVRRAERLAVGLKDELEDSLVIKYLNRLSDFLFVAARFSNRQCGWEEHPLKVDRSN